MNTIKDWSLSKSVNRDRRAGFASLPVCAVLVLVVAIVGYAGYRVMHKTAKSSVAMTYSNTPAGVIKYSGQSAANGQPLPVPPPAASTNSSSSSTSPTSVTTTKPSSPLPPPPSALLGGIAGSITVVNNCGTRGLKCPSYQPKPFQATVEVRTTSGNPVTSFTSDAQGNFSVNLGPGTYVLVPAAYNSGKTTAPQQTVAISDSTKHVDIQYTASY